MTCLAWMCWYHFFLNRITQLGFFTEKFIIKNKQRSNKIINLKEILIFCFLLLIIPRFPCKSLHPQSKNPILFSSLLRYYLFVFLLLNLEMFAQVSILGNKDQTRHSQALLRFGYRQTMYVSWTDRHSMDALLLI